MIHIAKQLTITIAFTAVIYGLLIVGGMALVPEPSIGLGLDSPDAANTVFMTQPKYVVLNRAALADDGGRKSVILIGSSNVARGFAQSDLQSLVPNAVVHNLAVSGSN